MCSALLACPPSCNWCALIGHNVNYSTPLKHRHATPKKGGSKPHRDSFIEVAVRFWRFARPSPSCDLLQKGSRMLQSSVEQGRTPGKLHHIGWLPPCQNSSGPFVDVPKRIVIMSHGKLPAADGGNAQLSSTPDFLNFGSTKRLQQVQVRVVDYSHFIIKLDGHYSSSQEVPSADFRGTCLLAVHIISFRKSYAARFCKICFRKFCRRKERLLKLHVK